MTQELKNSIKRLYCMLDQYPDEPSSSHSYVAFLRSFLCIESKQPLPKTEVMTMIKHHKPVVFSELRNMGTNNMMLQILTELSTDIVTANEALKKVIKQIN